MATDSQKTDIFRYMHVRPPQKISPVLLEEKYIEYTLGPSPFFTQLTGELSETEPRTAVEVKAQTAAGTTAIYADVNQLYGNLFVNNLSTRSRPMNTSGSWMERSGWVSLTTSWIESSR